MKVREVMTSTVVTVTADTPFPEIVDALLRHGISGVPVVDDHGVLVGIVTEADLVSKEAYGGRRRRPLEVIADLVAGGETRWAIKGKGHVAEELMTRNIRTITPTDDVRGAARLMVDAGVKRLPVVDDGRLVGMITRADLLRVLHRSDDEIRGQLTQYLQDPRRAPEDLDVDVNVQDGVVTVTGSVEHPMDLSLVNSVAWQVPGVVDVRNEATAREPDPKPA